MTIQENAFYAIGLLYSIKLPINACLKDVYLKTALNALTTVLLIMEITLLDILTTSIHIKVRKYVREILLLLTARYIMVQVINAVNVLAIST